MIKMKLKSVVILVMLASMATMISCRNSSSDEGSAVEHEENLQDTTLYAILEMEERYRLNDSLMLTFSVFNPTSDSLTFSKYHTPFEGFMNNFLTIVDSEGNEIGYNGPMAKRIMPPVEESYVSVAPNSSVSTTIDVLKAYSIAKDGTYTITYNGGNVSGMANGKPIQIILGK